MTSRIAIGTRRPVSRRAMLPLLAGALLPPIVLTAMPAVAQDAAWQTYRRDDLGFEVEIPGQPKLSKERSDDGWTAVDAQVMFADMLFGVAHQTGPKPAISIEQYLVAQRMASRALGAPVIRETQFTINGFAGVEIVMATDTFSQVIRAVMMGTSTIVLLVNGDRVHEHPAARRFLDSLKLLRPAR